MRAVCTAGVLARVGFVEMKSSCELQMGLFARETRMELASASHWSKFDV